MDEIVEAVKSAIVDALLKSDPGAVVDPNMPLYPHQCSIDGRFDLDAAVHAAIAAYQAALAEAGFVIVPKEPTKAMLAIPFISDCEWLDINQTEVPELWRLMIGAAPKPPGAA